MEYDTALEKFGGAYQDRKKELGLIFSMVDFRNKFVLEVGSGSEDYFIKELLKKTDNIMATDISEKKLLGLKKLNVQTKACNAEALPFFNRSFDIVFSRWVLQHVDEKKAVSEMCRVSDKAVVIVFPNEQGDETKLKAIVEKNNPEKRKKRVGEIKKTMGDNGFFVKEERRILNFRFSNIKQAMEVLSAVEFNNKVSGSENEKIEKFLKERQKGIAIRLTQGASFISGVRK